MENGDYMIFDFFKYIKIHPDADIFGHATNQSELNIYLIRTNIPK